MVPGSHRRIPTCSSVGSLGADPGVDDRLGAVPLVGPAGTAFVFSGHLLHGGTENRSDRPRPALQLSFRAR